jgi:hypothetical protein
MTNFCCKREKYFYEFYKITAKGYHEVGISMALKIKLELDSNWKNREFLTLRA